MEKEIKYKGKVITILFPSGYYQVYSDKEERFLKFDELDDAKALIDSEEGMKRGGGVGEYDKGVVLVKTKQAKNHDEVWDILNEKWSKYDIVNSRTIDLETPYSRSFIADGTLIDVKLLKKDGKYYWDWKAKYSNGGGVRTSNKESRELVRDREEFKANNLSGEKVGDVYVVKSYGYYPIFVYKDGKWYENQDKYSKSTAKQMGQARPTGDVEKVSTDELKAMYGFENGGEFEAASELRSLENTIENHLVNGQNISVEMLSMYLGRKPNFEESVVGFTVRKCFLQPYFKKIK